MSDKFITLTNAQTGQDEQVDIDDAKSGITSGVYMDPGAIPSVVRGNATNVTKAQLGTAADITSPQVTDPGAVATAEGNDIIADENSGVAKGIEATALGAARGLTLHGSDWLLDKLGIVSKDDSRDLQSSRPWLSGIGEFGGALAPALLTGGATAPESLAEAGAEGAAELGAEGVARGAAEYAPTSVIARGGRAVQEALGGGRIGQVAAAGVDNGLYQGASSLIDGVDGRNPDFSGEQWLHDTLEAAGEGAALGAGGIGLAKVADMGGEALGSMRRMLGLGDREALGSMRRFDAKAFEAEPYKSSGPPDLTPGSRGEAVYNGATAYKADFDGMASVLQHAPGGFSPAELENVRLLRDKYLPHLADGTLPAEAHAQLLKRMAMAEDTAAKLSKRGLGGDLPDRWGQLQRQMRQDALKEINLAPDVPDSVRVNRNIGAHVDPVNSAGPGATLRDSVASQLNDATATKSGWLSRARNAVASKAAKFGRGYFAKLLKLDVAGHALGLGGSGTGGLGGALGAGAKLGAVGLGVKAIQKVFSNPRLAALGGATAAQVLHRATLGDGQDGDRRQTEPRGNSQAAADYVKRASVISPQMAAARTMDALKGQAVSPAVAWLAAQAAQRRQQAILASLPATVNDPTVVQRFTDAQARTMADVYRAASHPEYALEMAKAGRLTPTVLKTAERVWPGTMQRIRSELVQGVMAAGGADRVEPATLRVVRDMQDRGDRASYGAFIQASIQRGTVKPRQPKSPAAPVGGGSGASGGGPWTSEADRLGKL